MFDAVAKNTLAPLVLRLALAATFTYHGALLVQKDWGTKALRNKRGRGFLLLLLLLLLLSY
ncbi:MAG TPA: hypothetical protein VGY58_01110 [Gemmataceae bacterium]|nr:hypothetical protein [Gemmataceae bacterium]